MNVHRFDHAVIGVSDLTAAAEAYRALGFEVYPGGRHTGLGTENAIVRFGLDYLELLSVYDAEEAARAGARRSFLSEFLSHQDGGLLGFCLAARDLDQLARQFAETGLAHDEPFAMQRLRPDGKLLRWRLIVPGDTSWRRPWPFFIEWEMEDRERLRSETPGSHEVGATAVAGVEVIVREADAARRLYSEQIGLRMTGEGRDDVLGATRLSYAVGDTSVDALIPSEGGALAEVLDREGEGLYRVRLRVGDLEAAARRLGLALEGSEYLDIPAERALGARLRFVQL